MSELDIKAKRKELGLTQADLAKKLGLDRRTIISYEQGAPIPESTAKLLHILLEPNSEYNSQKKPEAVPIHYTEMQVMYVPLVSYYAYGGYGRGYGDPEYIESLPKIPFAAEVEHKGDYLCFEVKNDSMNDGTVRSIIERDIILTRNIRPDLWQRSRLHLHKWQVFVIVHKEEGIMVKEITKHDVEKGIITIHSYNDMYEDREVELKDVAQIFNVVEVRRR